MFTDSFSTYHSSLQRRHNGRHGVSNHRRFGCLLNHMFRRGSKKTSKLCVTGLCEGNLSVTGGYPSRGKCFHLMTSSISNNHFYGYRMTLKYILHNNLITGINAVTWKMKLSIENWFYFSIWTIYVFDVSFINLVLYFFTSYLVMKA